MPELKAFAICPTCSELYPSSRGCPRCDGVHAVAAAPEPEAADAPADPIQRAVTEREAAPRNLVPALALLGAGVVVMFGVLISLVG